MSKEKDLSKEEVISDLHKSLGWGVVSEMAAKIMEDECNLEDVSDELPDAEYKAQCVGRKKAKKMFKRIFEEVKGKAIGFKKNKPDYS